MNGLDKIIARMEADTRAECNALAANAAENAAAILRDYQAQADAAARDSAQRAEAQAAEHLEHLNGSSQLACGTPCGNAQSRTRNQPEPAAGGGTFSSHGTVSPAFFKRGCAAFHCRVTHPSV